MLACQFCWDPQIMESGSTDRSRDPLPINSGQRHSLFIHNPNTPPHLSHQFVLGQLFCTQVILEIYHVIKIIYSYGVVEILNTHVIDIGNNIIFLCILLLKS